MTDLAELARQLGPEGVARNPQLFADLTPDERKLTLPHVPGEPTKADIKAEKDLQIVCEQLLAQRHYHRLTAENAERLLEQDEPCAGWYGHWVNSKRNPLMSDLLVMDREGEKRPLLVELKHGTPRWQLGQAAFCQIGLWTLCADFEEFEIALSAWEQDK